MTRYQFVTVWRFRAPIETTWPILRDTEAWPSWWAGVRSVDTLEQGDDLGIGLRQRFTWRSRLPYSLVFDSQVVKVVALEAIEGVVSGELVGTGVWTLSQDGPITTMRYDWDVATTRSWMNALAPIARPIFAWNHDVVMRGGGEGLARLLNTPLISDS